MITPEREASYTLENELLEKLVNRAWVSRQALDDLIQQQQSRYQTARQRLDGVLYAVDPGRRVLLVQSILTGEPLREIPLGPPGDQPSTLLPALHVALLDAETAAQVEALKLPESGLYGLVVTAEDAYLYPSRPLEDRRLALSRTVAYPGIPSPESGHFAYDLTLSPDQTTLYLVDREAGNLLIVDLENQQLIERVTLRPQGSKKGINLAFDALRNRVLLTDNQSFMLYALDEDSFELSRLDIGLSGYALGQLAVSPDGDQLYLLTLKPSVELLCLDLDSHELIKSVSLKGELFSNGLGCPQDLLLTTPNQSQLLVMTYLDEPAPQTPLLTVIQTARFKTTQRYALKDQPQPTVLAFAAENLLCLYQKTGLEMVLEAGLVTPQQLASLTAVDLDAPDAPDEGQGAVPVLAPQAAEPIELPEQVLPVILAWLGEKYFDLSERAFQAAGLQTLFETAAESLRLKLETHDLAEVSLELPDGLRLASALGRQELLARIDTANRQSDRPEHCPLCAQPLEGWDCPACGHELESPERQARAAQASLLPTSEIPPGQLLLADARRQRLLRLDRNRTLDWTLTAEQLSGVTPRIQPWTQPSMALGLPGRQLLVVDTAANQVYECGPAGQLKWMLHQQASTGTMLVQPVKAGYFVPEELILIVDQGQHRVLAVDRHSKLRWQYGRTGEAGNQPGQLREPADLQWTWQQTCLIADTGNHRVIEVQRADGALVRSFGAELGLNAPCFAQRLDTGHTLIVDAGNYRVLELDGEGEPVLECFYFKAEMGEAMRIDRPSFVMRGDHQNLILMDETKVIELLPAKRRLIWSSLLEHLADRVEIQDETQNFQETYVKSFYQHRLPTMEQIIDRIKQKTDADGGLAQRLMETFHRLVEVKRQIDADRADRSRVRKLQPGPLLELPIYVVDRTHRQLLQIDRNGQPVWHFGSSEFRLQRPTHVVETDHSLLLADTLQHTVLEIDSGSGEILLSLGGKDSQLLNQPRSAWRTLTGHTLIADQGHRRLIEVSHAGDIVWEYKQLARLMSPYFAAEQGTGTLLFVDWALQMVTEITRDGTVIWTYGQSRRVGDGPNQLSSPEYAIRLPSGATLIADTRNHRVLEVAPNRKTVWEYRGSSKLPLEAPCFCKRLPDGHTLIASDNYRQLVEVDAKGKALWHMQLGNASLIR